jgi:anti-sigma factor (TIGR02949 family)
MSCGNPHETPCHEVDAHLDEFLDRELTQHDVELLEQHFRECPPCRAQLAFAILMKKLVARSCGTQAPMQLRQRIEKRITEIRTGSITITVEETRRSID